MHKLSRERRAVLDTTPPDWAVATEKKVDWILEAQQKSVRNRNLILLERKRMQIREPLIEETSSDEDDDEDVDDGRGQNSNAVDKRRLPAVVKKAPMMKKVSVTTHDGVVTGRDSSFHPTAAESRLFQRMAYGAIAIALIPFLLGSFPKGQTTSTVKMPVPPGESSSSSTTFVDSSPATHESWSVSSSNLPGSPQPKSADQQPLMGSNNLPDFHSKTKNWQELGHDNIPSNLGSQRDFSSNGGAFVEKNSASSTTTTTKAVTAGADIGSTTNREARKQKEPQQPPPTEPSSDWEEFAKALREELVLGKNPDDSQGGVPDIRKVLLKNPYLAKTHHSPSQNQQNDEGEEPTLSQWHELARAIRGQEEEERAKTSPPPPVVARSHWGEFVAALRQGIHSNTPSSGMKNANPSSSTSATNARKPEQQESPPAELADWEEFANALREELMMGAGDSDHDSQGDLPDIRKVLLKNPYLAKTHHHHHQEEEEPTLSQHVVVASSHWREFVTAMGQGIQSRVKVAAHHHHGGAGNHSAVSIKPSSSPPWLHAYDSVQVDVGHKVGNYLVLFHDHVLQPQLHAVSSGSMRVLYGIQRHVLRGDVDDSLAQLQNGLVLCTRPATWKGVAHVIKTKAVDQGTVLCQTVDRVVRNNVQPHLVQLSRRTREKLGSMGNHIWTKILLENRRLADRVVALVGKRTKQVLRKLQGKRNKKRRAMIASGHASRHLREYDLPYQKPQPRLRSLSRGSHQLTKNHLLVDPHNHDHHHQSKQLLRDLQDVSKDLQISTAIDEMVFVLQKMGGGDSNNAIAAVYNKAMLDVIRFVVSRRMNAKLSRVVNDLDYRSIGYS